MSNANAQLTSGEYFFDTAPANGGGTAISFSSAENINQTIAVPISTLSTGFHNLFIRVKDVDNVWSHYEGRTFYIIPPAETTTQPQLVSGEWFIDTDPGLGNGTLINFTAADEVNPVIAIPSGTLSIGIHHLFIRVKDASGVWSHYEGREFTNDPLGMESNDLYKITLYPNPTNSILNVQMQQKIEAINIVDTSGRTTAIKTLSSNSIDVSSLANGVYFIEITTVDGQFRKKFIKN